MRKLKCVLLAFFAVCGGLAGCKDKDKQTAASWWHFKANAPTETSRGNVEFWIDKDGKISLTRPESGLIEEGPDFDSSKFKDDSEIWIENEIKVSIGDNSFVVPLSELPSVYYKVGSECYSANLKLIKDVTLTSDWTAIGSTDMPFMGTFDGNNKTIKNVKISKDSEGIDQGFFGVVSGATIKDLKLDSINIQCGGRSGGVVGFVKGGESVSVENCHVLSGSIKSTGFDAIGGIIGAIYNPTLNVTVKNCSNAASVETEVSPGRAGGIIGLAGSENSLLLEGCTNKGTITAQNSSALVGGTRGSSEGATYIFKNCKNEGTAKVPFIGFFNSASRGLDYLTVKIEDISVTESALTSLFSCWQSGGSEGGILTVNLNEDTYKYVLIPTYTYSTTQGKMVVLETVYSVEHPMNQTPITEATADQWAEFIALNPKIAVYNEDSSFKGVSSTTNCYAPNNYYITGASFGAFVNCWVKVVA